MGSLPGGYSSTAYWVNNRGDVMGGSENGLIDPLTGLPEQVAVVWKGGQIQDLGTLGGSFSFGNAMNDRDDVVGIATNTVPDPFSYIYQFFGSNNGTQTRAFVWDKRSGMRDLDTLGGPDSWAASINERGQAAGWALVDSTVTRLPEARHSTPSSGKTALWRTLARWEGLPLLWVPFSHRGQEQVSTAAVRSSVRRTWRAIRYTTRFCGRGLGAWLT